MTTHITPSREFRIGLGPSSADHRIAFVDSACALWNDQRVGRRPYSRLFLPHHPYIQIATAELHSLFVDRLEAIESPICPAIGLHVGSKPAEQPRSDELMSRQLFLVELSNFFPRHVAGPSP